jgi:L-arabinokinase
VASVFFYISGHGFGHASREIEVINAFRRAAPDVNVVVRTSAARWLFDRTVRMPFTLIEGPTDTGVVQIDSLRLDERATIRDAADFHRTLADRARDETALLREHDARLVICDAPPLGCAAAALAGIPSIVLSNFTWDWIYQGYAEQLASDPKLIPRIQDAYRTAAAGWRLPMHGGFQTFTTIVDLPFVARHATCERRVVRDRLGLPQDMPLVLSSFGGYGVRDFDLGRLDCLDAFGVVITTREPGTVPLPRGVFAVREQQMYEFGLRYEDLAAAFDVVATKPGYGILSECIANDTAVLYTSRGRFVEYEALVAAMPRYLRSRFIAIDELLAGRWRTPLEALVTAPPAPERPRTDGAEVAKGMLVEILRR